MDVLEWTVAGFIIALILLALIFLLTKDRRNRKLRIGFFLERERFEEKEKEDE